MLPTDDPSSLARPVGFALLAMIVVGILGAVFVSHGIDVNLTADVEGTAEAMLDAEQRLRGKAYLAAFGFGLEAFIAVGFFLLLRRWGLMLASWSLAVGLVAATVSLHGAVFALNAAELGSNAAFAAITDRDGRLLLAGLQATSDYTSFHLSLVLASVAKAAVFMLFLRSRQIPRVIAGWGLFASSFVAAAIVMRDFVPVVGHPAVTGAFMVSNLVALVSTGGYLAVRGVREPR